MAFFTTVSSNNPSRNAQQKPLEHNSIQINPSITSKIPSNSPKTARGTARARRIKRRVRKAVSFRRKSWGPGRCLQLRNYQGGFNGFGDLMLISWGFTVDLMGCIWGFTGIYGGFHGLNGLREQSFFCKLQVLERCVYVVNLTPSSTKWVDRCWHMLKRLVGIGEIWPHMMTVHLIASRAVI